MFQRRASFTLLLSLSVLVACGDDDGPDDVPFDGDVPDAGDMGVPPDGMVDPGDLFPPPVIMDCPADPRGIPADLCEVTAGTSGTLITADILTPGLVYRDGKVLVDASGQIMCVGCDCEGGDATELYCPEAVLSPGLVNGHDHLAFNTAYPYPADDLLTDERYEHRHEWRGPENGHTRVPAGANPAIGEIMRARSEIRHLITGTTSSLSAGSSVGDGLMRNLDSSAHLLGLTGPALQDDTFPLGSGTNNVQVTEGCDYQDSADSGNVMGENEYVPHVAEGISQAARNEYLCMRDGDNDIVEPGAAFIHGVGLNAADIAEMAASDVELIWSPRTNITLYGDTARVSTYARLGATIGIGTDWLRSGSMNMLRELACADSFNQNHLDGFFPDEQLWLMATRNTATALGFGDQIGTIATGYVADLALYDGRTNALHRAVIGAGAGDVLLVLRAGEPMFGDTTLVSALSSECSDFGDTCGRTMSICLGERGQTFAEFEAEAVAYAEGNDQVDVPLYPLFYCGEPEFEPSCLPARVPTDVGPGPVVNGSNTYSGMSMAGDSDGDGIMDADDNCPTMFNPIRPMDGGAQADFDADGIGDECDICPLGGDDDPSTCIEVDTTDRDGDGIPTEDDNCPTTPNPDQADMDDDGIGDACDACPMDANPGGGACPSTIYAIKMGDATGTVFVESGVVVATGPFGFTMQVSPDDSTYTDANFSGLYVYTGGAPQLGDGTPVTRGMNVDVTGSLGEFMGQTQFDRPTITMASTSYAVPTPVVADPADVATGGSSEAALESVLVTVEVVTTTAVNAGDGEFTVDDTLVVDDLFYRVDPFATVDEGFASITGVMIGQGTSKLNPRDADDVVAGDPTLSSLSPALTFAREGSAGATFPDILTVSLTRSPATDTTVTMTSSGAGATVTDVVISAGTRSAEVPVTGVTAGTYTITAALDGVMETAMVRVLGAAEEPTSLTLTPNTATVNVNGNRMFTVELDIPAPPGGLTIEVMDTTGGSVPATILIPENGLSATFAYDAPASETTGTITTTIQGTAVSDSAAVTVVMTAGTLVINEVDYDQPGTDGPEYLELFNPGATAFDTANIQVLFVNGSGGSVYETIELSTVAASVPAGQYVVLHAAGVTPAAGALTASLPGSIQNGGPDGLVIWNSSSNTVVDALSYEGSLTNASIGGMTVNLVEGTAATAIDGGPGAMARIPNGSDTDDADTDWASTMCLTPGEANTTTCP